MGNSTKQALYLELKEREKRLRFLSAKVGRKHSYNSYHICRAYRDWKRIDTKYFNSVSVRELVSTMNKEDLRKYYNVRL